MPCSQVCDHCVGLCRLQGGHGTRYFLARRAPKKKTYHKAIKPSKTQTQTLLVATVKILHFGFDAEIFALAFLACWVDTGAAAAVPRECQLTEAKAHCKIVITTGNDMALPARSCISPSEGFHVSNMSRTRRLCSLPTRLLRLFWPTLWLRLASGLRLLLQIFQYL